MPLRDEQADILGGPILQRPESCLFPSFVEYRFVFKSVTFLVLGVLVWIVCMRGLEYLKKHRELGYRKAMRRKHGIPDSDCRPFAVAYAAVKRTHLEREAQDRKKTINYVSGNDLPVVGQRTEARKDARGLRRRIPETTVQLHDLKPPAERIAVYDNKRPAADSLDFAGRYNPNPRRQAVVPRPTPVEWYPIGHASRKALVVDLDDNEESKKRSFEGENDVEHEAVKKSRIDEDEFIDGDEQTDWYAQYSDKPLLRTSNGSLRKQPQDDYIDLDDQERPNDLEDHEHDETMEGIDEGEVTSPRAVARGKKRDRAAAGSTLGGDDDDILDGVESHHSKRRTTSWRRMEVPPRGQKRDREAESPDSEGEDGPETSRKRAHQSSKKKRGKPAASNINPRVSKDPLCGGRNVGDEWESDGIQYKVGDKGERLRLTLVRKARNKFHMPQDSQHPDRSAALEIYVETWMTDEQYVQAEGKQELAWQEAPRESSGPKSPDVFDSPAKNGKPLLWNLIGGSSACRPPNQIMPTGMSTRNNPFGQGQLQPPTLGRRVASSGTLISPMLPGVNDIPGFRGFSKWEKQDREAEAMARIRAKVEEQKKIQLPPQKTAEISASATASGLATTPLSVPTITLTPAPTVSAEGVSDESTRETKAKASTVSSATLRSASDSIRVASPSIHFPSAASGPTASSSTSPSLFSFTKPPQLPSSTSSSTIPFSFERTGPAGVSSSSTASFSTQGATTQQPQPPATATTSSPAVLSFAKPDISPFITSTSSIVDVPPTAKPQVPFFSTTSSSSPSPATFGSAFVATKKEASLPSPVLTSVPASESSRPTAPLFSFSGTSSPTATLPTSLSPPAPKFSVGQPSTAPTTSLGSNLRSNTTSVPKSAFKFGQISSGAMDTAAISTATDESNNLVVPPPVISSTASGNESTKPSPPGISASGNSIITPLSTSVPDLSEKPVDGNNDVMATTPFKPMATSAAATTFGSTFSSAPTLDPIPSNGPIFSFSGTNSGPRSAEVSKPVSLFGSSSAEGKPTFTFGVSGQGSNPSSIFGSTTKKLSTFEGSAEGSKLPFTFGGSMETSKPASIFSSSVEGSKPTFAFSSVVKSKHASGPAAEGAKPTPSSASDSSKNPNITDALKPAPPPGRTIFGLSSSASTFPFGKDDVATNASTSTSTQTKRVASFGFESASGMTGSLYGQPSTSATSNDPNQATFGKSSNTTPSAFGFAGTGGPSSSTTFTFGKPMSQNQKQEQ